MFAGSLLTASHHLVINMSLREGGREGGAVRCGAGGWEVEVEGSLSIKHDTLVINVSMDMLTVECLIVLWPYQSIGGFSPLQKVSYCLL